jgi:hypothetical protein
VVSPFRACIRVVSGWSVVAVVCWSLNFGTARAGVLVVAPTLSLPYSAVNRTETFDVYVEDSGGPSQEVSADNVELALPDTPSVFFTGAGATTTYPYLYGGSQSPGFCVIDGGSVVLGSDFAPGVILPTLGSYDGLLQVDVTILGGTSGVFPLTFEAYGPSNFVGTALFDQNNDLIPISLLAGAIDVFPAPAPVPEPSSALLAILCTGFVVYRRRRANVSQRLAYK